MRRNLFIASLVVAALSAGCGSDSEARPTPTPRPTRTVAAEATTAPTAPLPTAPPSQQPTPAVAGTLPRLVVTTDGLNLRSGPGTENAVVSQLKQGDAVQLLDRSADGTWLQVRLLDDTTGWVSAEFVRSESAAPDAPSPAPADAAILIHSGPQASGNPPMDLLWTNENIWNNNNDRGDLIDPDGEVISTWTYGDCQ